MDFPFDGAKLRNDEADTILDREGILKDIGTKVVTILQRDARHLVYFLWTWFYYALPIIDLKC